MPRRRPTGPPADFLSRGLTQAPSPIRRVIGRVRGLVSQAVSPPCVSQRLVLTQHGRAQLHSAPGSEWGTGGSFKQPPRRAGQGTQPVWLPTLTCVAAPGGPRGQPQEGAAALPAGR